MKNKAFKTILISLCTFIVALMVIFSFLIYQRQQREKELQSPEYAIKQYIHEIQNNTFDQIYQNSIYLYHNHSSQQELSDALSKIYQNINIKTLKIKDQQVYEDGYRYTLYQNNEVVSQVMVKSYNDHYLVATLLENEVTTYIESLPNVSFTINDYGIDDVKPKEITATNFEGLEVDNAPTILQYTIETLSKTPNIALPNGYTFLKDLDEPKIYIGKLETNTGLHDLFINAIEVFHSVIINKNWDKPLYSISIPDSAFLNQVKEGYPQLQTLEKGHLEHIYFSDILKQSEDSMMAHVTFDYVTKNDTKTFTYQIIFLKHQGIYKIAQLKIEP
ncbi:MAG: NTF2-like N-terminal transpeptidase domain-containing protein [Erysipelotrichaceae bacterium]|nr:NTF2-like N-terminal transpeptidase domain-containing protein [Erysipelotrichaceae bacterium]